jgi:hypothetical protein
MTHRTYQNILCDRTYWGVQTREEHEKHCFRRANSASYILSALWPIAEQRILCCNVKIRETWIVI